MQDGEDFVKALRVEELELRNNPKHHPTRGRTVNDGIFSNKTIKTISYV